MAKARRVRANGATRTAKRGERADERLIVDAVPATARDKGDYAVVGIPGPQVIVGGKETATVHRVVRNRGGTTIERWQARGDLSRGQIEAIAVYVRSWRLWIGEQRVTANWGGSIRGGEIELDQFVATKLKAKAMLAHLDEAVFFALPLHYFETWRNVVIFDEAAGVAGSRLGYVNQSAETAAKAIVLIIADMIATDLRLGDQR